jgi:hypothetical protein
VTGANPSEWHHPPSTRDCCCISISSRQGRPGRPPKPRHLAAGRRVASLAQTRDLKASLASPAASARRPRPRTRAGGREMGWEGEGEGGGSDVHDVLGAGDLVQLVHLPARAPPTPRAESLAAHRPLHAGRRLGCAMLHWARLVH